MAKKRVNGARKTLKFAGVLSGVATTALCLTFAVGAMSSALRPLSRPLAIPVAAHASHDAPNSAPHPSAPPVFSAKLTAQLPSRSLAKLLPAKAASATAAKAPTSDGVSSARTPAEPGDPLLRADSKCSRTRGQPELG